MTSTSVGRQLSLNKHVSTATGDATVRSGIFFAVHVEMLQAGLVTGQSPSVELRASQSRDNVAKVLEQVGNPREG